MKLPSDLFAKPLTITKEGQQKPLTKDSPIEDFLQWTRENIFSKSYPKDINRNHIDFCQGPNQPRCDFVARLSLPSQDNDTSIKRPYHGAQHGSRTAIFALVMINYLRLCGDEEALALTVEDVESLQNTCIHHDTGRENEGEDYWDKDSGENLARLFIALGIPKPELFAEAVANKDRDSQDEDGTIDRAKCIISRESNGYNITWQEEKGKRNIYDDIIRLADQFDIHRVRDAFEVEKLPTRIKKIIQDKDDSCQEVREIAKLIRETRSLGELQGDGRHTFDLKIKEKYELAANCFKETLQDLTKKEKISFPMLDFLYNKGNVFSRDECATKIQEIGKLVNQKLYDPKEGLTPNNLTLAMEQGILFARGLIFPTSLRPEKISKKNQLLKSNETSVDTEIRKMLRRPNFVTRTGLRKSGNCDRSSCMLGGAVFSSVGFLMIGQNIKIKTIADTDCNSGIGKDKTLLKKDDGEPIKTEIKKAHRTMMLGGKLKTFESKGRKFLATHNEAVCDIKNVKAIYFCQDYCLFNAFRQFTAEGLPYHRNAPILEAISIQKAYRKYTGLTIPIFEYSGVHYYIEKYCDDANDDKIIDLWTAMLENFFSKKQQDNSLYAVVNLPLNDLKVLAMYGKKQNDPKEYKDILPADHYYSDAIKKTLDEALEKIRFKYFENFTESWKKLVNQESNSELNYKVYEQLDSIPIKKCSKEQKKLLVSYLQRCFKELPNECLAQDLRNNLSMPAHFSEFQNPPILTDEIANIYVIYALAKKFNDRNFCKQLKSIVQKQIKLDERQIKDEIIKGQKLNQMDLESSDDIYNKIVSIDLSCELFDLKKPQNMYKFASDFGKLLKNAVPGISDKGDRYGFFFDDFIKYLKLSKKYKCEKIVQDIFSLLTKRISSLFYYSARIFLCLNLFFYLQQLAKFHLNENNFSSFVLLLKKLKDTPNCYDITRLIDDRFLWHQLIKFLKIVKSLKEDYPNADFTELKETFKEMLNSALDKEEKNDHDYLIKFNIEVILLLQQVPNFVTVPDELIKICVTKLLKLKKNPPENEWEKNLLAIKDFLTTQQKEQLGIVTIDENAIKEQKNVLLANLKSKFKDAFKTLIGKLDIKESDPKELNEIKAQIDVDGEHNFIVADFLQLNYLLRKKYAERFIAQQAKIQELLDLYEKILKKVIRLNEPPPYPLLTALRDGIKNWPQSRDRVFVLIMRYPELLNARDKNGETLKNWIDSAKSPELKLFVNPRIEEKFNDTDEDLQNATKTLSKKKSIMRGINEFRKEKNLFDNLHKKKESVCKYVKIASGIVCITILEVTTTVIFLAILAICAHWTLFGVLSGVGICAIPLIITILIAAILISLVIYNAISLAFYKNLPAMKSLNEKNNMINSTFGRLINDFDFIKSKNPVSDDAFNKELQQAKCELSNQNLKDLQKFKKDVAYYCFYKLYVNKDFKDDKLSQNIDARFRFFKNKHANKERKGQKKWAQFQMGVDQIVVLLQK